MGSSRKLIFGEKKNLYFSGTSYLGLNYNQSFIDLQKEGLSLYGSNYGGSRRSPFTPTMFAEFEEYFANKNGYESALLCSSGSMAAHLVLQSIPKKATILKLKTIHPTIGITLTNKKKTFQSQKKLIQYLETSDRTKSYCLIIESIDAINVDKHIDHWIEIIADFDNFTLIIDDSHGIGVLNLAAILDKYFPSINIIVLASLGKAYASPKGIVFSSKKVKKLLMKSGLWGGSSPGYIADLYAIKQGEKIIDKQLIKLQSNIEYFKTNIDKKAFKHISGFPVFRPIETSISQKLKTNKILISAFNYPSDQDPLIERIVINGSHKKKDINKLIAAVNKSII